MDSMYSAPNRKNRKWHVTTSGDAMRNKPESRDLVRLALEDSNDEGVGASCRYNQILKLTDRLNHAGSSGGNRFHLKRTKRKNFSHGHNLRRRVQ